jgi:hypothetical protein
MNTRTLVLVGSAVVIGAGVWWWSKSAQAAARLPAPPLTPAQAIAAAVASGYGGAPTALAIHDIAINPQARSGHNRF